MREGKELMLNDYIDIKLRFSFIRLDDLLDLLPLSLRSGFVMIRDLRIR